MPGHGIAPLTGPMIQGYKSKREKLRLKRAECRRLCGLINGDVELGEFTNARDRAEVLLKTLNELVKEV